MEFNFTVKYVPEYKKGLQTTGLDYTPQIWV